ncbi:gamma-glutamyltransferase [Sulfitobacter sp. HNIBRBA3233]|uniref:gamma-glutamyltransferase n=1 Tax=Sulfitobacter marinivivus TaxID=3158558 RepID=UPI0032E045AE
MRSMAFLIGVFAAGAAMAQQAADGIAPEAAGAGGIAPVSAQVDAAIAAKEAGRPVRGETWMVAAANPLAVQAGADALAAGGSAADALVVVQTVLGLVEPQSSGLGGGAFLVWYDAQSGQLTTLDGRETAPLAATPQLFQDAQGEPLKFFDAVVGGRSVGTPGTPALLAEIHQRWGTKDWATLLAPAIELAEAGFAVSPRLAQLVEGDSERLASSDITAEYFMPGGAPVKAGDTLVNLPYAETLRSLAAEGVGAFYAGDLARSIVATVQTAKGNPGVLSEVDLAIYRVKERAPVCAPYRAHEICGMGPPSSGALAIGQILGLLESFDLAAGPQDATVRRLMGDAARLAFADRGRYVADTDYVPVPVRGMLDPAYLAQRADVLTGQTALEEVAPGTPAFDHALIRADDEAIELPSTSHISIVDAAGNVASMTTTIENGFGSRLMVGGFLLNNEMTDFSFRSHVDGVPIANRVEPGKRPRSSMAPTIVMRDGQPVIALGSPGGSRIIGYTAQTIVAMLDWGMDPQQAVMVPHAVNRFGTYDLEEGTAAAELAGPLGEMGFDVETRDLTSGLHVIAIDEAGMSGGADPRREGIALGD